MELYLQSPLSLHGLVLSNRDHFTFTFFIYLQACEYLPIYVINCNAQKALEDKSCSVCREIPCILWKWSFATVFTIFRHCLYPEPYQWGHRPPILFVLRSILILSSHLRLGLRSCLSTSGFVAKPCFHFSWLCLPYTAPMSLILLICSLQYYFAKSNWLATWPVFLCFVLLFILLFPWELFYLSIIYLFV